MGVLNRLQKTQPERVHKDSDRRLEEFKGGMLSGVLLLDDKNIASGDVHISVTGSSGGRDTFYEFQKDNAFMWHVHKDSVGLEPQDFYLDMSSDMKSALESLKQLGMQNGSLMQRAIAGITVQSSRAIRINESLMTSSLRRARLSVSKDGNLIDERAIERQNQGGRD